MEKVHEELEEKLKKAEDELKWKTEQFKHLEEAHEKLKHQFNTSKSEWETEKLSMLEEIDKLNERLDAECSTAQAGEDGIANLRHSLRVKEMECKDLEYKAKTLESENRDLLASIKELQEAHIPKAVTPQSSWVKLKNKVRNLEQTHRDSSATFKAKEAEWNTREKKMTSELNRCSSTLKIRDQVIDQLKNELEDCHSSLTQLKMQNEELSLMLQLMKSESSECVSEWENKDSSNVRERYLLERELIDKSNEIRDLKFEVLEWKMLAENMKDELEVGLVVRRELELSLLDQTELEEILKQDVEEKNQRISNLQQQIVLMDEEIMIREENNSQENESTSLRWQAEDDEEDAEMEYDDEHEQELLLAKELEISIISHIMEEKGHTKGAEIGEGMGLKVRIGSTLDDEDDEICSAKENVVRVNSSTKMGESFVEDSRSPFRVLN